MLTTSSDTADSSFFYTCTQDFRVQMYDTTVAPSREVLKLNDRTGFRHSAYYTSFGTTQYTSLKPIRTIQGRMGNWTITDANLSPDNQWMIYSSITPVVHLVPTKVEPGIRTDASDRQVPLDFSDVDDSEAPHSGVSSRRRPLSVRSEGTDTDVAFHRYGRLNSRAIRGRLLLADTMATSTSSEFTSASAHAFTEH